MLINREAILKEIRGDATDPMLDFLARRELESKRKKGRRLVNPPRPRYPIGIERQYSRRLKELVQKLEDATRKIIIPRLASNLAQIDFNRPKNDSIRHDIEDFRPAMEAALFEDFSDEELDQLVLTIGNQTNIHSREGMRSAFQKVLGVNPLISEPWLAEELSIFMIGNVRLIQNVKDKYLNDIDGIIMRGARDGTRASVIGEEITRQIGITKRRAELIARDQVASFNAQMDKLHQTSVGITKYKWRTVKDARVRPDHRVREGQIFDWNDPPSDGHAGMPINCRCTAEPIFSSIE